MTERITSPSNALIRRARSLSRRKGRQDAGAFLVEGIRPVGQAVDHGASLEMIFAAPELLTSEPARRMVERQREAGVRVVEVSDAVFARLAEREHPSGLAAIVRIRAHRLEDLPVASDALFVAVYEVGNPGNLGTIVRTMDAVSGGGVIVIGSSTDPYHPAAVKAGMGALFSVPLVRVAEVADVKTWARACGISVVTTSDGATRPHWSVQYRLPCLLLLGSEGAGLPDGTACLGDQDVRIPMAGTVGSLNLAVAAGILLYEARRASWRTSSE